jgi:hypothetical protein
MKRKSFLPLLFLFVFAVFLFAEAGIQQPRPSPLEEELQKLRKAGIPTTIEELALPKIPDEENARFLYQAAGKLLLSLRERDREMWESFPSYAVPIGKKITEEEKRESIDYILNNPEFNRLCEILEKAASMECRFFDKSIGMEDMESLQTFAHVRAFARILADKAKIEAEHEDVSKALKSALAGLRLGDSLSNEPRSIAVLSQTGLDSFTIENLQDVIEKILDRVKGDSRQDIEIYQDILKSLSKGRVSLFRQLITGIILENRMLFTHYKNMGEEMFKISESEKKMIEMARPYYKMGGNQMPTPETMEKSFMERKKKFEDEFSKSGMEDVKNFIGQQEVLYLSLMNRIIPLLQKTYYETGDELNKTFKDIERETEKRYTLCYIANPTSIQRMLIYCVRHNALSGAAEIGLANALFKIKNGRYIGEPSELVPNILPSLPLDPFTGKNYIYKKTEKGFIVYSVGDNLKDDGGISQYEKGRDGETDIIWRVSAF